MSQEEETLLYHPRYSRPLRGCLAYFVLLAVVVLALVLALVKVQTPEPLPRAEEGTLHYRNDELLHMQVLMHSPLPLQYAFEMYKQLISHEIWRHRDIFQSKDIAQDNRQRLESICDGTAEDSSYINAIRLLSDCLHIVHRKKVIILIDEYDVPLENAYFRGFYDEMVDLIRSAFESALKTNNSLEFGVLT